jgi:hypothetical protein
MARRRSGSAVVGIVLACAGIALLFWNEGRAVDRLQTIAAGRDAVVEADPDRLDAGGPERLLHLVGEARGERVADPDFKVTLPALRLDRKVEMFQWVEKKQTRDGTTDYTYTREWSETEHRGFHVADGHANPGMPYRSARFYADTPRLGRYTFSQTLLDELEAEQPVTPTAVEVPHLPPLTLRDGRLHSRADGAPEVGDMRVGFAAVANQTVSVLAVSMSGVLQPFRTPDGDLAMVEPGAMTAAAMLDLADTRNAVLTWGLRFLGAVLVFLGLLAAFRAAVSWIPFAQGLARGAAALLALVLALPIALSTIAFAWLWHRPLLAVGLLLVAAIVPAALVLRGERARRAGATAGLARTSPSPPPPPPR